jgi:hypothetical protein
MAAICCCSAVKALEPFQTTSHRFRAQCRNCLMKERSPVQYLCHRESLLAFLRFDSESEAIPKSIRATANFTNTFGRWPNSPQCI